MIMHRCFGSAIPTYKSPNPQGVCVCVGHDPDFGIDDPSVLFVSSIQVLPTDLLSLFDLCEMVEICDVPLVFGQFILGLGQPILKLGQFFFKLGHFTGGSGQVLNSSISCFLDLTKYNGK